MKDLNVVSWGWPPNLGKFTGSLWTRYSMTGEQYRNLWKAQGGLCPGCKCELANPYAKTLKEGPKPHVDYWRDESKEPEKYGPVCRAEDIRGLLCGPCLSWLDNIKAERERIKNLVQYMDAAEVKRAGR